MGADIMHTYAVRAGVCRVSDAEEQAQIARARLGDDAAIRWLVARYRDRVVRLAAHILRRPAEAEDAAQEVFIRAFRSLSSYRGDAPFYAWIYTIAVRLCLDRRSLTRWGSEVPLDAMVSEPISCDDEIGDAEARILAGSLLDQLSPEMRAMLILRELEELEYHEIAGILKIPMGRVKWRLHQARARFQAIVQRANEETDRV